MTEAVRKVDAVERRLLKAILTVAINKQEQEIEHFRKGVYIEVNDLRKAEIDELLRRSEYASFFGFHRGEQ